MQTCLSGCPIAFKAILVQGKSKQGSAYLPAPRADKEDKEMELWCADSRITDGNDPIWPQDVEG